MILDWEVHCYRVRLDIGLQNFLHSLYTRCTTCLHDAIQYIMILCNVKCIMQQYERWSWMNHMQYSWKAIFSLGLNGHHFYVFVLEDPKEILQEFKREAGWSILGRNLQEVPTHILLEIFSEIFRKSWQLACANEPPQTPPTSWAPPPCRAASMLRWLARTNTSARDTWW